MKKSKKGNKSFNNTITEVSHTFRKKLVDKTIVLAEPICSSQEIELVHIQFRPEAHGNILRVYIDKPGGIKLDDCVNISRKLGEILDISFENDFSYNLEISSPGENRPIRKKEDFERFKGRRVKIKTYIPLDVIKGKKKINGILNGVSGNDVNILFNNEIIAIPFDEIANANLSCQEQAGHKTQAKK